VTDASKPYAQFPFGVLAVQPGDKEPDSKPPLTNISLVPLNTDTSSMYQFDGSFRNWKARVTLPVTGDTHGKYSYVYELIADVVKKMLLFDPIDTGILQGSIVVVIAKQWSRFIDHTDKNSLTCFSGSWSNYQKDEKVEKYVKM
jgi:hypothetical protein